MSLDPKTQAARAKMLNTQKDRWSIGHANGLQDLYANAAGSIYTAMGGGNLPAGAKSPGLNQQIGASGGKGINRTDGGQSFFGFGRGNDRSSSSENHGTENISGGQGAKAPKMRGTGGVLGFTTFRAPMTDHDYGSNKEAVETLAMSSWYTQNLGSKDVVKYGEKAVAGMVGGRGTNSRAGGKQGDDNR